MANSRKYKESITISSPPSGVDSWGDDSGSWTDVATLRAEVKQVSGTSLEAAQQQYSQAIYRVECRYDTSLTLKENYRISWITSGQTKTLEIGSIENVNESNRVWVFLCSEVRVK